jgi:uncharacterized protein (DUF2267 family)
MSVRPETDPKEVVLEIEVDVNDEYINEHIEAEGVEPPRRWAIEFDLKEVPASLRAPLREAHRRYLSVEPYPVFPAPTDDPRTFLALIDPWLESAERAEAAEESERQTEEQRAEDRHKAFLSTMAEWARANGSPRLKAALERGYKANTTYALERATQELPGFWVDTAGDSEWGERSDPSEGALELERAVQRLLDIMGSQEKARIVWLITPPRQLSRWLEEDRDEYFEAQEAILVGNYLGRYPVILPADPALRREDS